VVPTTRSGRGVPPGRWKGGGKKDGASEPGWRPQGPTPPPPPPPCINRSGIEPLSLFGTTPARDSSRKELLEEIAFRAELLLPRPRVKADAFADVPGQEPTEVSLPGPIHQTGSPLLLRALDRFPASMRAGLRSVMVNHEQKKSRLLHRRPRIPPSLFTALNRAHGHAQHVCEFGLPQPHRLSQGLQVDARLFGHSKIHSGTRCPRPGSLVPLSITM